MSEIANPSPSATGEHVANGVNALRRINDTEGKPIELVFGLVGPTGVDLQKAIESLQAQLAAVQYENRIISLSTILLRLKNQDAKGSEYDRISALMNSGNELRKSTNDQSVVAKLGLVDIRNERAAVSGDETDPPTDRRMAYIIRSFKRKEEVQLYRDIYGKAFTLISIYAPKGTRTVNLARRIQTGSIDSKKAEELSLELVNRDYKEEHEQYGQRVGETFPLADFFLSEGTRAKMDTQLRRLVRLTFGDPYISPSKEEEGMFFAQASAFRSLDLSRQVGAAIVSQEGDLIATGCNDVPMAGGGLYWASEDSYRDYELGHDPNISVKQDIVEDAYGKLREARQLSEAAETESDRQLAEGALFGKPGHFRKSKLANVIEFGRSVHAEMAAITQAARLGVRTKDARMFSTTFPCHICARHIVSAGIKELVFIEPYEKSKTGMLFADSVSIEPDEPSSKKVNFHSFVGVAPRRYMDFFQATGERKAEDGTILRDDSIAKTPKVRRIVFTYTLAEDKFVLELAPLFNTGEVA